MKKKVITLVIFLILSGVLFTQSIPSFNQVSKLSTLAKVWGVLKYFHPGASLHGVNWDQVLFDAIDKIKNSNDIKQFNDVLGSLIDEAGIVNLMNYPDLSNLVDNENHLHSWIRDNSLIEWHIAFKLKILIDNFRYFGNRYISYGNSSSLRPTEFKNELKYTDSVLSEKHRLLALFRYWNIINYFFPNKQLMDKNWNDVLDEFIPKILDVKSELQYQLILRELVAQINDSHAVVSTAVLDEYFGGLWPPFEAAFIDGKTVISLVYEDSLRNSLKLLPGDIVTRIGDKPVENVRNELRKYIGASNPPVIERNLNKLIFRSNDPILELQISRNNKISKVFVDQYEWEKYQEVLTVYENNKKKWEILDGNIGFINMGNLTVDDVSNAMEAIWDTKAVIFDIRNYPTFIYYEMTGYLLKDQSKTFSLIKTPDQNKIGAFKRITLTVPKKEGIEYYKGKVILLVNEITQSLAEFTCMAFQTAPDVTTIGSQTAGADGNVSPVVFPGGIITWFSGMSILYPDGRETQRIGIDIDIIKKPTIQGLSEGRDEVLEYAIDFINQSSEH